MKSNRLAIAMLLSITFGAIGVVAAEPLVNADKPPMIPVGLDAFRMWDRWAYLRIGQRTYMSSTFDRRGANEAADASHFLYQLADDKNISLDVRGPGVLAFKRTNHWHGSPWHYIVDGTDHIVTESSTPTPDNPVKNSIFEPADAFPHPLTWTWSVTKGADLMWVPIMFEDRFTLGYGRTHYGTGYYIYHKYLPGIDYLSQPIKSWTPEVKPGKDVLDLINKAGSDIAPEEMQEVRKVGTISLESGQTVGDGMTIDTPQMIRALEFEVSREDAIAFGEARLQITWDDSEYPSIDAPIALLFGTGTLYNRENKQHLVKAFPVNIEFAEDKVRLGMYFPMPYFKSMKMSVTCGDKPFKGVEYRIRQEPYRGPANHVAYFHATYKDHPNLELGRDIVMLDTTKVEGGGDWSGHFVGTSFIFSHKGDLRTLEGDPRFYFDDSQSPQAQGTGTEEWGGGGDYWGGRNMTIPFAGHPVGCRDAKKPADPLDLIQSEYRYLLADLFPFGKNAKITFEHGGESNSRQHYSSVVYWYGINEPFLVRTDELNVGDATSEKQHAYDSPNASDVQTIASRYEWGVDQIGDKVLFEPTEDTERHTTTGSSFVMKIDPKNLGVMLRRKMDYSYPNQCARVFVSDAKAGSAEHEVGLWYTAGSNTVVYSNPRPELGETEHHVQTSNRRWREDEFLLPPSVTQGLEKIRVRVEFMPQNVPLFPGHPQAEQAWSEVRYWAYSFVMPQVGE